MASARTTLTGEPSGKPIRSSAARTAACTISAGASPVCGAGDATTVLGNAPTVGRGRHVAVTDDEVGYSVTAVAVGPTIGTLADVAVGAFEPSVTGGVGVERPGEGPGLTGWIGAQAVRMPTHIIGR